MDDRRQRLLHRRPWWRFNVIPLMVALFVLVWVRHLTNLGQLATYFSTVAVICGWIALGAAVLYAQEIRRAATEKRLRMVFYVAVPILFFGLLAWQCHRQARLIEDIWDADGGPVALNEVTFTDGTRTLGPDTDRKLRRYWGSVQHVNMQRIAIESQLIDRLSILRGLQSLSCKINGKDFDKLDRLQQLRKLSLYVKGDVNFSSWARLQNLEQLDLTIEGNADFSALRQLKRLKKISLLWRCSKESSLESLADLPITRLFMNEFVNEPKWLTQVDVAAMARLPQLEQLELTIDGNADFLPLQQLPRLKEILLRWSRPDVPSLGSLAGLPVRGLVIHERVLTQSDITVIRSLPLSYLILRDSTVTSDEEQLLRQRLPNCSIFVERDRPTLAQ